MSLIIGLHGCKGAGKDQFYHSVKAHFPQLSVKKIAYADPIKNEVCRIFDLKDEQEYDLFKRRTVNYTLHAGQNMPATVHGRQIVREIGMLMRRYDEGQFVKYVEDTIASDPASIWCITDLRFDNELESIREMGGIVIKIKRPGFSYDGHVTETEFPDEICTSIIHNDSTLAEYEDRLIGEVVNILQTMSIN